MPTSGVYTETVTATSVFEDVLMALEVLGTGETPTAEDISIVKRCCNRWLKQLNGPINAYRTGDMPWTREDATLALVVAQTSYDLQPSGGDLDIQIPSEIISVVYQDSSGNDNPLYSMSLRTYNEIPDKDASGTPERYYYERRLDKGILYLDYAPSAADDLIITYKQSLEIIDSYTDEFDIDPAWEQALIYNVAILAAPFFGINSDKPKYVTMVQLAQASMEVVNSFYPNKDVVQVRPYNKMGVGLHNG